MKKVIKDFLLHNRVGVLAIALPDGTPHAATLHYSHGDDPLTFFFSTTNTSRKCVGLLQGEKQKASVVIGFSEQEWKTIQLDGEVQAVTNEKKLNDCKKIHYAKHPSSKQYEHDPETQFLMFTPTWWRFTDYNTNPPIIMLSEEV